MAKLAALEAALADLRASADELDKLDDELTGMIPAVEEALRNLRLGVRICIRIDRNEHGWEKLLAFDRHGKDWRLLIEEGPEMGDAEDWSEIALASAPRDERAAVFEWHLNSLLISAADQIRKKVESRRATIDSTKSVVETVKKVAKARKEKS